MNYRRPCAAVLGSALAGCSASSDPGVTVSVQDGGTDAATSQVPALSLDASLRPPIPGGSSETHESSYPDDASTAHPKPSQGSGETSCTSKCQTNEDGSVGSAHDAGSPSCLAECTPRDGGTQVDPPSCTSECTPDTIQCDEVNGSLQVQRCAQAEASGCFVWQTVTCDGGDCLTNVIEGACNPDADTASCVEGELQLCAKDQRGCPVWSAPNSEDQDSEALEIDVANTTFTAYGILDLALQGSSASAAPEQVVACLRDQRPHAVAEDSPAVSAVTAGSGEGHYRLELSRYQLPVAYKLSVAVGNPPTVASATLAADPRSRVAFISKTAGTGDLGSWTPEEDTPLQAADAVCQRDAEEAGLAGQFRAFLSIEDQVDAICRLRGGEGLFADGCGLSEQLTEEQLTAPFLNMKGLPVAYGTADIEQGLWRLPIGYQPAGDRDNPILSLPTWTGSERGGLSDLPSCDGWSSASGGTRGTGSASPAWNIINNVYTLKCDTVAQITCFSSVDGYNLSLQHLRSGLRVFALETQIPNDLTAEQADALCAAAEVTSNWTAWFSDSQNDALCRVAGSTGKVEDNCGVEKFADEAQGPWVRSDGYLVAENLSDLASSLLQAPINMAMNGVALMSDGRGERVRTDTSANGRHTTWNDCSSGSPFSNSSAWSEYAEECGLGTAYQTFLYCFER